jgi:hypothetical protein
LIRLSYVALLVGGNLGSPETGIGRRDLEPPTILVSMPETTMHEHRPLSLTVEYVWRSGKADAGGPVTNSQGSE